MAPGVRPVLAAGDLLAGRYRLESLQSAGPIASLWRATDEVLARPVAVKVLPMNEAGVAVGAAFLAAAGRASTPVATALVRVYDAAREPRRGPRGGVSLAVSYVISEWVDGRTLPVVLAQDGPLPALVVARLGVEALDALKAAHRQGLAHGRLHPGNVLLDGHGQVRLTDTAVAAALAGEQQAALTVADQRQDTRDLAACLSAALTGLWPAAAADRPSGGIPAAPATGRHSAAPRVPAAGVPRELDAVLDRALTPDRQQGLPPLTTPAALKAALAPLLAEASARAAAALQPVVVGPPSLLRRSLPWVAAAAFISIFATSSYFAGRAVGELPPPPGGLAVLGRAKATSTPGVPAVAPLDLLAAGVKVSDYDPDGDGRETPSMVVNAYDQDPITAWTTSTYSNASFGGLKPGVGLLVDFGRPTSVSQVGLGFTMAGSTVQLRAGDVLGANEQALPVVASQSSVATAITLQVAPPVPHRYWLVWITQLPPGMGSQSRVGISAMVFSR